MGSDAKWYFTHEADEDRLWYQIFFAMCKKFDVSWAQADSTQQAFIEEITRYNYESEIARRNGFSHQVKGFFDEAATA